MASESWRADLLIILPFFKSGSSAFAGMHVNSSHTDTDKPKLWGRNLNLTTDKVVWVNNKIKIDKIAVSSEAAAGLQFKLSPNVRISVPLVSKTRLAMGHFSCLIYYYYQLYLMREHARVRLN